MRLGLAVLFDNNKRINDSKNDRLDRAGRKVNNSRGNLREPATASRNLLVYPLPSAHPTPPYVSSLFIFLSCIYPFILSMSSSFLSFPLYLPPLHFLSPPLFLLSLPPSSSSFFPFHPPSWVSTYLCIFLLSFASFSFPSHFPPSDFSLFLLIFLLFRCAAAFP